MATVTVSVAVWIWAPQTSAIAMPPPPGIILPCRHHRCESTTLHATSPLQNLHVTTSLSHRWILLTIVDRVRMQLLSWWSAISIRLRYVPLEWLGAKLCLTRCKTESHKYILEGTVLYSVSDIIVLLCFMECLLNYIVEEQCLFCMTISPATSYSMHFAMRSFYFIES